MNVIDDDSEVVCVKLLWVFDVFEYFENEYYEVMVMGVVVIGMGYWMEIYSGLIFVEFVLFFDM